MKKIVLKKALSAAPKESDFTMIEVDAPECPDGGVLVKLDYISIDPYVGSLLHRGHMQHKPPVPGSGLVSGAGIGKVIESKNDAIKVGDYVTSADAGWAEIVALSPGVFRKVDPDLAPLSAYLGVLGVPGLTAWASVTKLAEVHEGDVFMVNAAAGPVAGTAGQLARAKGAKTVIGIASGQQKCEMVVDTYGFDACLDYKQDGWQDKLKQYAPDGITVHHENVGADMLKFAMGNLQLYGRIVLCGLAAHYHSSEPAMTLVGPIIGKRAAVYGLVVYDFEDRWEEFTDEMAPLVNDGTIKFVEDRVNGLENAPALIDKLMNGKNIGKCIVSL